MRAMRTLLLTGILATTFLAGCLTSDGGSGDNPDAQEGTDTTSVFERADLPFKTDDNVRSYTLETGPYDIIKPGTQYLAQIDLPPTEGGTTAAGPVEVSIGVHFPDIPGCDWEAESLPEECHVPVIADVGPYYSATVGLEELQTEGDAPVTEYSMGRLMGNMVENFVPHGYAVAAVSVLGTGDSGHCMDLMGAAEQAGVQGAVDFLGEAAWSNGAVALIGRSYDGSTPWEAAMAGSPHLKTIVPISGLMGQYDLMWRNGSAELRAPGVLYGLYAAMTIDGDVSDATQVVCPDYLMGGPQGVLAYALGGNAADAAYDYWTERQFYDDVAANYNGSIYYIHGMQDWNVDNHQAFPYYNMLLDEGFEMKGLFGQWDHAYPDRESERGRLSSGYGGEAAHNATRYDWAQDLLEWFDHYLKGTGAQPDLHVEIQDNMGAWRVESEYPPRDAETVLLGLDQATRLHGGEDRVVPAQGTLGTSSEEPLRYEFPPISETNDTLIAGNVLFHVTATPEGEGGQLFAELQDAETGIRFGHAVMDLRYAAGGKEMQPVVPGMPLVAKMEFFALDAVLPAGHGLLLEVTSTGEDYLPASTSAPVSIDASDASVLKVPTVDRDESVFFTPPGV